MWWSETMLKHEKVYKLFAQDCWDFLFCCLLLLYQYLRLFDTICIKIWDHYLMAREWSCHCLFVFLHFLLRLLLFILLVKKTFFLRRTTAFSNRHIILQRKAHKNLPRLSDFICAVLLLWRLSTFPFAHDILYIQIHWQFFITYFG